MRTAATALLATLVTLLPWAGCAAPAAGVRPVIDAGKYFDAASPTSGLQRAIDATGPRGGIVMLPPGV